MPESAGIQEILEILRFSGRGLSILGKGLILLGKGFDKAGKKTAIKITQLRLAISHHHSATENSYNTISLKTLEKITGGELGICSVPTEDKTKLAEFFNMCKSYKINCAPLPDLNVGDGLTQIAFDPSQSHLMEAVQEKFNNQLLKDSKESLKGNQLAHGMSFEDYYNTADEKTRDAFIKETADEVEVKQNKETPSISPETKGETPDNIIDFSSRKEKIKDIIKENYSSSTKNAMDYFKFDVPATCLVAETEKGYTVKIPNSYDKETKSFKMIDIPKEAVTKNGENATIYVKKDGKSLMSDSKKRNSKDDFKSIDNRSLFKEYFNKQKADKTKAKIPTPTPKKTK